MSQTAKSYERVHYEFRPAKQVERRMLLHTLQSLMLAGFPISDYKYVGLGSIYFIDFIMFHKYLGIKKFLSIEESHEITKRVNFNKPFKYVELIMGDILDYIPNLSRDIKHILWLDFDHILTEDVLTCVHISSTQLSAGSILLVTVDIEPPGSPEEGKTRWNPKSWKNYFVHEASQYLWPSPATKQFARDCLYRVNARLINSAISKGLLSRTDLSFYPLFNFIYADGNRMLSVGGMVGTEADGRRLDSLDRKTLNFLRSSLTTNPYEIVVPKITRKERLYLDSRMPCDDNWTPRDFELSWDNVAAYRSIYRYYPAYAEMFL